MSIKTATFCSLATLGLMLGSMGQIEAKCTPPTAQQKSELFNEIDERHQQMYNDMDCEGQNQAINLAQQMVSRYECPYNNNNSGSNQGMGPRGRGQGQGMGKGQGKGMMGQGMGQGSSTSQASDKNSAVNVAYRIYLKRTQAAQ